MKYKVLIVDDEPLARRGIRLRLRPYSDFVILDDCEDAPSAIEAIEKHAPDLVFLDIQMRGMNGFEMLNQLPKDRNPVIIFLTAYDQYALSAFQVHALDYLLKPVDSDSFAEAMARARRQLKLANAAAIGDRLRALLEEYEREEEKTAYLERFTVRSGRRLTLVLADEIDWFKAVGDHVGLHVGRHRSLIRGTL